MCFQTVDVLSAIAFIFVFDSSPMCFTLLPSRVIKALSGSQWWRIFWFGIYKLPSALSVWPFRPHHRIHISTGSSYHGPELFKLDINHPGQWLAHQHRHSVSISSWNHAPSAVATRWAITMTIFWPSSPSGSAILLQASDVSRALELGVYNIEAERTYEICNSSSLLTACFKRLQIVMVFSGF